VSAPADPDAPSGSTSSTPAGPRWRRPSYWIGLAEVVLGVGLSVKACADADEPFGMYAFLVPNLLVTLPGRALMRQTRARWWLQLIPVLFLAWVFKALVLR
jgi:hypothetical protein